MRVVYRLCSDELTSRSLFTEILRCSLKIIGHRLHLICERNLRLVIVDLLMCFLCYSLAFDESPSSVCAFCSRIASELTDQLQHLMMFALQILCFD